MRGMSLIEVVVVMSIIAILAAFMTPIVSQYVDESRVGRALADVRAIGEAISNFDKDVGRYPMFSDGSGLLQDSSANVVRLQSSGIDPTEASASSWTMMSPTDPPDCSSGCLVNTIDDQLLTNAPAYTTNPSLAKPFKWKGPYLEARSDPWGRRYLVNIINAKSTSTDACFVISAGPNGVVDTAFNIPKTSLVEPSNDDILFRIK